MRQKLLRLYGITVWNLRPLFSCCWGYSLGLFRSGVEIPSFGATISDAVARSSIVFCNSISADRIVMAASRLLRAVAACVIPLFFAAGSR